jgi:hypothetical protein
VRSINTIGKLYNLNRLGNSMSSSISDKNENDSKMMIKEKQGRLVKLTRPENNVLRGRLWNSNSSETFMNWHTLEKKNTQMKHLNSGRFERLRKTLRHLTKSMNARERILKR